jgi:A/G-specific adenine glycosylase
VTHVFTHYKLHIAPYRVTLAQRLDMVAQASYVWMDAARLADAALPAPIKKLLLELMGDGKAAQQRMDF